jgi:hypothetical protein
MTGCIRRQSSNDAVEQPASASRPWQAAQGKAQARGGPRPGRRPPLLTASVMPPLIAWLGAIMVLTLCSCGKGRSTYDPATVRAAYPMASESLFRADVAWIQLRFYGSPSQHHSPPIRWLTTVDSPADVTLMTDALNHLGKIQPPDGKCTRIRSDEGSMTIGTPAGVVRAAFNASELYVLSGPRTGRAAMPGELYDLIQSYREQATPDTLYWFLGVNGNGVAVR